MSTNVTPVKMPSLPLLQKLLKVNQNTPEWADGFPTTELQNAVLHRYRKEQDAMKAWIKIELL
jgi:hypothetical protein